MKGTDEIHTTHSIHFEKNSVGWEGRGEEVEKERVREQIGDKTLRIKQKQTESQQNKVKRKIIPEVWGWGGPGSSSWEGEKEGKEVLVSVSMGAIRSSRSGLFDCDYWNNIQPLQVPLGFAGGSDNKGSACSAGDPGSIPGSGRFPEKGMATHSSILA